MTARWSDLDQPFFTEWRTRSPGARRSLNRARLVATALGVLPQRFPVLTIVGSKGKGTATLHASATLVAAGLRVVTVTSPALVLNNERIRVDGTAIDDTTYGAVGRRLSVAAHSIQDSSDGYLSPVGSYTLAAFVIAEEVGADVVVCEEGLGGASDEVSLFAPTVVGVTPIFAEHLDILGPTLSHIAKDLLGVVCDRTKVVITAEQDGEVAELVEEAAARVTAEVRFADQWPLGLAAPAGLSAANAALGMTAGRALLKHLGFPGDYDSEREVLASIRLPGRLSAHVGPGGAKWIVDAAISPRGVTAALEHLEQSGLSEDHVVACFPDTKDVDACFRALDGRNVISVSAGTSYLTFTQQTKPRPAEDVFRQLDQPGRIVLALGTVSFVGEALGYLGVDCRVAFSQRPTQPGS